LHRILSPFQKKMTPEWQKKIKAAGVINERELCC
jgi:hypothetical protein